MPSGASHTATVALTNATLPFVLEMANTGVKEALQQDDLLAAGVNVCAGSIVHPAVAASLKVAGEMLDQVITKVLV